MDCAVFGASADSEQLNKEFAEQLNLSFPLLSDPDGAACRQLGILSERGTAKRTTYLVGPDAKVVRVWENVSIDGHAADVLRTVEEASTQN